VFRPIFNIKLSIAFFTLFISGCNPAETAQPPVQHKISHVIEQTPQTDGTENTNVVSEAEDVLSETDTETNPALAENGAVGEIIEEEGIKDEGIEETLIDNQTPAEQLASSDSAINDDTETTVKTISDTLDESSSMQTASTDSEEISESAPNTLETEFVEPDQDNIADSTTSAALALLESLVNDYPAINYAETDLNEDEQKSVQSFCEKINKRLSSVSYEACIASKHKLSPFKSVNGLPIVVTEFAPKSSKNPLGKVLVIGGTHGDELTSVSITYQWIEKLNKYHSGLFHWHVAPVINPDGLFPRPAKRTNANGIDINRNLPTPDWYKQSKIHWEKRDKAPRRNPGSEPASEPETLWIMHAIETFQPDAIVSIHAPYGLLDFDSPELKNAPRKFGRLKLNLLGTYPGSLGNYAGIEKKIPVLTLELPNAQYMPDQSEIDAIWSDMISWLKTRLSPVALEF
jgi:protein MpaA